ncbi:uncharacterized protein LOC112595511 [Melanaphis sacchari]|uniref:uncharacterized protein LOC112595511 n=1 Tax=Melanaphis sacchari TaxID=742174 RepID=UPI000DC1359F|nr:uncharacterized protein LOC112595511 [Melanaphis sacchari]
MKFVTKKYFWRALAIIIIVLIDVKFLHLLVPKLNFLLNGFYCNLLNYNVLIRICEIFKLSLPLLFLHFYLKYFVHRCKWASFKWLKNIIIGSYIDVFIIVLILSYTDVIIVLNTTFEKIAFVILMISNYCIHYIAYATNWFDKYTYSSCYTYTSTINHPLFKDRKYLIVTNLTKRWHLKETNKIAQKQKKIDQSAPQDPRLNKYRLVNKGLNDNDHKFTPMKTFQSINCEGEYLQSTRIVRSDTYYDQPKVFDWEKPELNEYSNKLSEYKLIPL